MGDKAIGDKQIEPNEDENTMDEYVVEEEEPVDAPSNKTDNRLKTPERSKPIKRSGEMNDDEPGTNKKHVGR